MSKITFRADDDLVDELESFDASKSEVMRDALRTYLDGRRADGRDDIETASDETDDAGQHEPSASTLGATIDALVRERVDELVERRLARQDDRAIDLTVNLDGVEATTTSADADADVIGSARAAPTASPDAPPTEERHPDSGRANAGKRECNGCGTTLDGDHVYCPNCGEKASRRVFCECGDEVRSDWSFCPGCGRRTPAADVLESR